jgi:protein PhnA
VSDTGDGVETKDSNGTALADGDSVRVIKDLKIRGSSDVLKRGTVIKNIRLTGDPAEIECRLGKSTIVLKTEFMKKA